MTRGYVAYLRETPAGFSVRKQRECLKSIVDELYRSDHSKFPIVAYIEDPGIYKAGDIKRNKSLRELLDQLIHNCDLNGVLFWHAGHIARSMDDFLAVINELERIGATKRFGLTWYIHRPELFDFSLKDCSNIFSEFLI